MYTFSGYYLINYEYWRRSSDTMAHVNVVRHDTPDVMIDTLDGVVAAGIQCHTVGSLSGHGASSSTQRDRAMLCVVEISLSHSRLLEVIRNSTIRKLGHGFLFAFHSNYGSILYHFRDKARHLSKVAIFFIPPPFDVVIGICSPLAAVPVGILPYGLVWKN